MLNSREISRQHAVLLRLPRVDHEAHQFRIIDGNFQGKPSTNGLLINGRPQMSHNLVHGDEIIFAATVDARYFMVEEDFENEWLLSGDERGLDCMATCVAPVIGVVEDGRGTDAIDEASLERLASFPELFPHPIIEVSMRGNLTYLNPAVVKQFPDIESKKLAHPLLEGVLAAVKERSVRQFTTEVTVDGHAFERAVNYISQSDLVRIYVLDVTERKRAADTLARLHQQLEKQVELRTRQLDEASNLLQQEEKALISSHATNRALLNAMPDPMLRVDRSANIVNFKVPKHHTLPFDPEQCMNRQLSEVLTPVATQSIESCISQALETNEIQVIEFQLPLAETALEFEARIAVSAPDEVMVIFRDITERKRSEADILRALARERELNELKTRFVAMTSHEFRTPLTTILSSAELLEYYSGRWEAGKQLSYLNKIKVATQHMIELLNDVLLLNKTESGKLNFNPQPLCLDNFCQEIIDELQMTTDVHRLVMRSQLSADAYLLDHKLMRHILTNLLSNAINYSPEGGEILVEMRSQENELLLSVKDAGIGIPEGKLETLFESFTRGSNVGSISGTGLGLAIVKRAVDLHQGRISCDSQIDVGTQFVVCLPNTTTEISSESVNRMLCSLSV